MDNKYLIRLEIDGFKLEGRKTVLLSEKLFDIISFSQLRRFMLKLNENDGAIVNATTLTSLFNALSLTKLDSLELEIQP